MKRSLVLPTHEPQFAPASRRWIAQPGVTFWRTLVCAAWLFASALPVSLRAEGDTPLIHLGFEGDLASDGLSRDLTTTPALTETGAVAFVEGIVGKGARFPDPKRGLVLNGPIFNSAEGTFSFWIKPARDFKPAFIGPFFFGFSLPGSAMQFYKIYNNIAVYESSGPQMTQTSDKYLHADEWRMLTFVYKQGYRGLYVDDVPLVENKSARNDFGALSKGDPYSRMLASCDQQLTYDEVTTWRKPFARGEVAALFYSRRDFPRTEGGWIVAPEAVTGLPADGDPESPAWEAAPVLALGYNSYTGVRVEPQDTVRVTHKDGTLGLLFRVPLPKDLAAEKTRRSGTFFTTAARQRDGGVLADDSFIVDLSPDGGRTNYRFAMNTAGVLYDARNGDVSFNHAVRTRCRETRDFWEGTMVIPLAGLGGGSAPGAWLFNVTRHIDLPERGKRQLFYTRGAAISYGTLQLAGKDAVAASVVPHWDGASGTLAVEVAATSAKPLTLEVRMDPLDHRTVFPQDAGLNEPRIKLPLARPAKAVRTATPVARQVKEKLAVTLEEGDAALSFVSLKDADGKVLYRDTGLVARAAAGALELKYLPTRRRLCAEITLPSAALLSQAVSAKFNLRAAGADKVLASRRLDAFHALKEETVFDMSALPVGSYEVDASLLVEGRQVAAFRDKMTRQEDPVWVGNTLGEMKRVPKPWTPLSLSGNAVTMWGRTYDFDHAFLPRRLVCLDQEMLAAPIRLTAEVDGRAVELTATSVQLAGADSTGMKVTLRGKGLLGPLAVTLYGWVEFDGFSFTRLGLKTPAGSSVVLNHLTLEIPFKKEMATLYDVSCYAAMDIRAGVIPKEGIQDAALVGQRVGTAERGIQWTIMPDEKLVDPQSKTLSIAPSAERTVVKLVLVNRPQKIEGLRLVEFGLQGLPARPFPRELRNYALGYPPSVLSASLTVEDVRTMTEWRKWQHPMVHLYSYGWAGKWNYLHLSTKTLDARRDAYQEDFDRRNVFPALYLDHLATDRNTPEHSYYRNEWSANGAAAPNINSPTALIKEYEGHDGTIDFNEVEANIEAPSYREFYRYYLDRALTRLQSAKNHPPMGVYFDETGVVKTTNPYLGSNDEPPGSLRAVLASRDFFKRAYAIVHARDPRNMVAIHQSGQRVASVFGFADLWIEGEQFTSLWGSHMAGKPELTYNDCYPTALSLDKVRAQFNSHAWGPMHLFLSQFWDDPSQKESEYRKAHPGKTPPSWERRFRYISGLMRVHDNPMWFELTPLLPTYTRMLEWGWNDQIEFVPYWDPRGAFEFSPGESNKVAVSAWYQPDGRLILCVFNGQKTPVNVKIALHPDRFPVKMPAFARASDLTSPDPVFEEGKTAMEVFPVRNQQLEVPVRPEDYRLLRLDP